MAQILSPRSGRRWVVPRTQRPTRVGHALALIPTIAAALLLVPSVAGAATLTVETTDDISATDCTLRNAITAANDNALTGACVAGDPSPTVDAIDFDVPAASTITLGSTLPDIATDMNIGGHGAGQLTISGNDAVQPFIVSSGATASISGLSIADGLCNAACGSQGGGVHNEGTLTLDGVNVTDNMAAAGGGSNAFAEGGGIENNGGTLTITDSFVSSNTVSASAASNQNAASAGGIMNRGTLTLNRSTMNGNSATTDAMGGTSTNANGGAINNSGALTVRRSTLVANTATGTGGSSNSGVGGAIANFNSPSVDVTIDRSTVSGNSADQQAGGLSVSGGTATVTGSTFNGNSAASGANVIGFANTTFRNTIVSDATGGGANCGGAPASAGYNLEDGSAPGTCGFTQPTDLHADPMLDANLADNGGPTETRALLAGSPAIDAGRSFGASTDQRGEPRPFDLDSIANATGGDGADVGAFEVQGTPVATSVKLTASRKKVPEGKKVKLRVSVTPCPGRAGDPVKLHRGKRKVATKSLSGDCKATFKQRIKRTSTFKAVVPAETEHLKGTSNKVKVRVRR